MKIFFSRLVYIILLFIDSLCRTLLPFTILRLQQEFAGAYTNIRTSVLDKKKAALVAIGSLAEHAPRAFYPHLPHAMETLTSQVCYGVSRKGEMLDSRLFFVLNSI